MGSGRISLAVNGKESWVFRKDSSLIKIIIIRLNHPSKWKESIWAWEISHMEKTVGCLSFNFPYDEFHFPPVTIAETNPPSQVAVCSAAHVDINSWWLIGIGIYLTVAMCAPTVDCFSREFHFRTLDPTYHFTFHSLG